MAATTDVAVIEKRLINVFDALRDFMMKADKVVLEILGIAAVDLPKVADALAAGAGVLSVAIPQAGAVAAILATAATVVRQIDSWALTTDGVLMDPAEATKIGLKLADKPPTHEQKAAFAVQRVKALHPQMHPSVADNAAHLAVQMAIAQIHHVDLAKQTQA